jgi:chromatin remodeling complex protein RSC6
MVDEQYFTVKVPIEKVTLNEKGIVCLGIECFAINVKSTKKYITLYFEEKNQAQTFVEFINRHARQSPSP